MNNELYESLMKELTKVIDNNIKSYKDSNRILEKYKFNNIFDYLYDDYNSETVEQYKDYLTKAIMESESNRGYKKTLLFTDEIKAAYDQSDNDFYGAVFACAVMNESITNHDVYSFLKNQSNRTDVIKAYQKYRKEFRYNEISNEILESLTPTISEVAQKRIKQYSELNEIMSSVKPQQYLVSTACYESIYKKIGIYNRNTQLLLEGRNVPTKITYTKEESISINEMLEATRLQLIMPYLCEDWKDGFERFLTMGQEAVEKLVKKFTDLIPQTVIDAFNYLGTVMKNGIQHAKQLLQVVGKLFEKLGDRFMDGLDKLGFFKDEFVENIPETEVPDSIANVIPQDENKGKALRLIIGNVIQGVANKDIRQSSMIKESLNEDIDKKKVIAGVGVAGATGAAVASGAILPVALLAGGGYGLYKLMKTVGPKLSDKLEPYLLSDKSKELAQKLYDNPVSRYGLGLSVKKNPEEGESKIHYFGRICQSIFVNFVIAFLISAAISLFITTVFATGPMTGLVVACIISGKNVVKIIVNRILNMKHSSGGDGKKQRFFDLLTMVGLLGCCTNVVLNIPGVKDSLFDIFRDNVSGISHETGAVSGAAVAKKLGEEQTGTDVETPHSGSGHNPVSDTHSEQTPSVKSGVHNNPVKGDAHQMTRSSDAPSNDVHGNNPASNSHQENIPSGSSEKDIQASQNNLDKTTQAIQHSTNSEPINVPSGDEISLDQLHKNIPDNMKTVLNRLMMSERGDGFCLGGTASKVLADNSSMNLTVKETDSYKQLFSSCHSIVDEETGMRSILAGDTFASSDVLTDGNQKVVDISVIWSHNCDANNVVKVADAKLIHVGITKIVSDGDNEVMKVFGGYVDMSGKIVALDNEDGTDVLTTAEEIAMSEYKDYVGKDVFNIINQHIMS